MKRLKALWNAKESKLFRFVPVVLLVGLGSTALLFQNCSANFSAQEPVFQLSISHPSIGEAADAPQPPPVVASSKLLIGDQRFLESAIREAFLTPESPPNETGFFDWIFREEFSREQHLLGRGCDPIEYGDGWPCYASLGNANLGMNAATSSGREAARLQVCRRTISNGVMMDRAIGKVKGNSDTPNPTSIENVVRLFYPNTDQNVVDATVEKLAELNAAMESNKESVRDRWNLIFLTVCESSGWEAL